MALRRLWGAAVCIDVALAAFRYRLTLLLWSTGRPLTVSELVAYLDRLDRTPDGRPGKVVSDALRWEMRRGRVRRVGRGLYSAGMLPRSTRWWMKDQIHQCEESTRDDPSSV